MIVFDVPLHTVLTLVAGIVLPLLVGLVTTRVTSSGQRAVLLAGLAAATSLATELAAALSSGAAYNLGLALLAALGTFLVAVGTHYGLWKPTGVTDTAIEHGRTASAPDQQNIVDRYADRAANQTVVTDGDRGIVSITDNPDRVPNGPDHRA